MTTETAITVYNRHTDCQTDITQYYRTIIPEAHVELTRATSNAKTNHKASGRSLIMIPKSCFTQMLKEYVLPEEFASASAEERASIFTLQPDDIVIIGECNDEIPSRGLNRFSAEHATVAVTEVKDFTFGSSYMHHFEVIVL